MSQATTDAPPTQTSITCKAGNDAPVRKCIVAAMFLGISAWTAYDAYVIGSAPYVPFTSVETLGAFCNWAFNHFAFVLLTPVAIVLLRGAIKQWQAVMVADNTGLGYRGKQQVKWNDIQSLDATKISKGLLTIQHGPDGQPQNWELDAYFFKDFKGLVAFIEQHVPREKIQR